MSDKKIEEDVLGSCLLKKAASHEKQAARYKALAADTSIMSNPAKMLLCDKLGVLTHLLEQVGIS